MIRQRSLSLIAALAALVLVSATDGSPDAGAPAAPPPPVTKPRLRTPLLDIIGIDLGMPEEEAKAVLQKRFAMVQEHPVDAYRLIIFGPGNIGPLPLSAIVVSACGVVTSVDVILSHHQTDLLLRWKDAKDTLKARLGEPDETSLPDPRAKARALWSLPGARTRTVVVKAAEPDVGPGTELQMHFRDLDETCDAPVDPVKGLFDPASEEAAERYAIARRSGSKADACVQAGLVVAALQGAKNQIATWRWKHIEKRDCAEAGRPIR